MMGGRGGGVLGAEEPWGAWHILAPPGPPDPANLLSPADNPRRGRSHGQLAEFGTNPISGGMTEVIEDAQGLLPGVASLLPMVGGEVGVAEVGEGVGLAEAVSEVAEDGPSLLVVAEQGVTPADVVEGRSLRGLVIDRAEHGQGLLGMVERVAKIGLAFGHPAEGLVRPGLAGAVAELPVQPEAFG